jgi:hypothetical protein
MELFYGEPKCSQVCPADFIWSFVWAKSIVFWDDFTAVSVTDVFWDFAPSGSS